MSTGEESVDQANLRRSARIIALEKRKEKEKKELQAARKNNNNKTKNNGGNTTNSAMDKGKGKAIEVEHGFDFMDDDSHNSDNANDDDYLQYAPTKKKGRKSKTLQQLIMQPMPTGQHSGRNKWSSRFSLKDVLEFVLDALQRRDTFGLFAEPINSRDEVYYRIVKQPMDFATMRAKLHKNLYTDLESFKRDVYLICSNATSIHPSTSFHYQVSEGIREVATSMFSGLQIDPGRFDSLVQICQLKIGGRNPHRPKNLACFKHLIPTERVCGANNTMQPKLERRLTYMPPKDDSMFSQVVEAHKENLQYISPAIPSDYKESLARFTEGLGPTAQKVAAKQIERLRFNQMLFGETPSPNPLAHFLHTTTSTGTAAASTSQEPAPHAPVMQGPSSSNGPNGPNGPMTIPFATPEETYNSNNDLEQSISDLRKCGDIVGWNTPGSLLGDDAYSKDQNEGGSGFTGLDLNNDKMGSISSLLTGPGLPSSNLNLIDRFTAHAATRNPQGSNTRAHCQAQVWPTTIISGPQPKPLSNINRRYSELFSTLPQSTNNLSSPSLDLLSQIMKPTDQPIMDYNYSNVSEQSPFLNGNNNFTFQSFMSLLKSQEPLMTDYDFSGPPMQPQPHEKPTEPMNFTWQSFMPQSRPNNENIAAGSTSLYGQSLAPQAQKLKAPMIEPMMGYSLSEHSFLSQALQSPQEPMIGYNNNFSTNFQSMLGSTNFNNVMPSVPENASLYTPAPPPQQQQMYGLSQDPLAMQPGPGPSLMSGPLGFFPQDDSVQLPPLPQTLSDEMPMGLDAYYGPTSMGAQPAGGGVEAAAPTSQILWDDPRLPNLSLQL